MVRIVQGSLLIAVALGLAACGGDDQASGDGATAINLARIVGTQKNAPDEFAVIPTAPLRLPKDFTTLPPPNPGQRSPLVSDPISDARTALLGDDTPKAASTRVSGSEAALLSAAGSATPATSDIRAALAADQAAADEVEDLYVLDRVFPVLRGLRGADQKDLLRPEEERQRLSELAQTPITNSDGIATIAGPAVSTPQPTVRAPTVNPTGSDELIYIPE